MSLFASILSKRKAATASTSAAANALPRAWKPQEGDDASDTDTPEGGKLLASTTAFDNKAQVFLKISAHFEFLL
jgi:hypothetical protein